MKKNNINKQVNKIESTGKRAEKPLNNGDREDIEAEFILGKLKKLFVSEKWIEFSGNKVEDEKKFLNQFIKYEGIWSQEKLLNMVKTKLKFRALVWFEAHIGESFTCYEEFKQTFVERFINRSEETTILSHFGKFTLRVPNIMILQCLQES